MSRTITGSALVLILCGSLLAVGTRAELPLTPGGDNASGTTRAIPVPKPTTGAATTVAAPASKDGDLLRFRNGDTLHGTMISVVPEAGIRWRHLDVKEPITFDSANAIELQLGPRPPRTSRAQHRSVVELTNGDQLAGDIVSLSDKTLVLNTWYAGSLQIKRPMIQRIMFTVRNPEAVYLGPTGLDGWVTEGNRNAWTYRKGAFYCQSNGSLGRDVKLPDVSSVEFDLAWRGQLYFQFAVYVDDLRQIYNAGGYMFQFNYASVTLQRARPQRGFNNLGNPVELPEFQRKTKAHVAVRVNKPKKTIALFVDGTLLKQWSDPGDFAGKGTGLVFMSQGQGQFRISNISVTEWDGRLDTDVASAATQEDLVRFANNDKVSGNLGGIANKEITFTTSFANMEIPLERVQQIELASQKSEKARRQAADVRAFFIDGSRFTLALEKLDEQNLVGSSENCGRVSSSLDAFRRVQFHIYEQLTETGEAEEWGSSPATGGEEVDE